MAVGAGGLSGTEARRVFTGAVQPQSTTNIPMAGKTHHPCWLTLLCVWPSVCILWPMRDAMTIDNGPCATGNARNVRYAIDRIKRNS